MTYTLFLREILINQVTTENTSAYSDDIAEKMKCKQLIGCPYHLPVPAKECFVKGILFGSLKE